MLKINKKMEYAVAALLYLDSVNRSASTREIARNCGVPEAMLSKILQALKGCAIVAAVHGNRGGYRLIKPLSEIPLSVLGRALGEPGPRAGKPGTPLSRLAHRMEHFLDTLSLESLLRESA